MKNKSDLRMVAQCNQAGGQLTNEESRVLRAFRSMTAPEREVFLFYGEDRAAHCLQQKAKQTSRLKVVK